MVTSFANTVLLPSSLTVILIECVQGEGGVNALSKEFVKGIEEICNKNDIVFRAYTEKAYDAKGGQNERVHRS